MNNRTKNKIAEIGRRLSFRVNDMETSFNKSFQLWLYANSYEKEIFQNDQYGRKRLSFDDDGFITNATFSGKTASGFDLLKEDFIKEELEKINKIDVQHLDLDGKKYIAFLKAYFENKEPDNKPKNKKDNAQYHVISFILDCYANKKQLPTGKQWEKAGEKRKTYTKKGNTFYKAANKILDKNFTKHKLSNLLGDDWRSIVLERSDDPITLKVYLDTLA